MEDFIYTEKFDDFLKGKLSKNDNIKIEGDLQQDPLLRSEVRLQQEIYQSLGEARKSYLKNRLDQVPVNTGFWYNITGLQIAAVISSLIFVTGGTYYYFNQSTLQIPEEVVSVEINIPHQNLNIPLNKVKPVFPVPQFEDLSPDDESLTASNEVILPENKSRRQAFDNTASKTILEENAKKDFVPNFVRPDVQSNFNEGAQKIDYADFEAPDKSLLQSNEYSKSEVQVETMMDSKYAFHYQLFNNKLFLHGDFQGIPYKVIALNQKEGNKLFLEYNGDYYKLNEGQKDIIPLEVIKDSTIINALNKLNH